VLTHEGVNAYLVLWIANIYISRRELTTYSQIS
jgi:hypothetical protein